MSRVGIAGAHHTPFGRFARVDEGTGAVTDTRSFYELLVDAGRGAIADAGLEAGMIDAVYVGSCSPALFVNQEHVAAVAAEIDPALRFKPMTRVEGACASSTLALYDGVYAIEAGRCERVLVIGVEKMSLLDTAGVTRALAMNSWYPEEGARGMTFPGLFAELAKAYQAHYRLPPDELRRMLAAVSALAYRNGAENPLAHYGPAGRPAQLGLFSAEAILALPESGKGANVEVAPPLRLHDCSLITDGAAALVLTRLGGRAAPGAAVEIGGIGHTVDRLPLSARANRHVLEGAKAAREKAFAEAGITIGDVDLAEVHDCFTINQLLCTEALGLSADGRAGHDYLAGRFTRDDRCPVNLSGGLKSKGHPVGATGASMHALVYRQLVGRPIGAAPARSAGGPPHIGVVMNIGGAGVTSCVTVLRRT